MHDAQQLVPQDVEPAVVESPAGDRRHARLILYTLLGTGAIVLALYHITGLIRQNRLDPRFTPVGRVDLREPATDSDGRPTAETVTGPTLRVAVAPVISPEKSLRTYQGLVDYLAKRLQREPVFLQAGTYQRVNDLVRSQQCDVALVCTYAFVRGEEEFGMQAIAVPVIGDEDHYHSYIIVPQSSGAVSLLGLRGKRFGSANRLSNSGYLYPMAWLEEHGEDSKTFFQGNHVITGSHDRSVQQVASQRVDGAAVDSLVYEQMVDEESSIGRTTKIIDVSPEYGMPPVVIPRQLDPQLKNELLDLLLKMHQDQKGKEVLHLLRIDRFVCPRDGLFDSVRRSSEYLESRQ